MNLCLGVLHFLSWSLVLLLPSENICKVEGKIKIISSVSCYPGAHCRVLPLLSLTKWVKMAVRVNMASPSWLMSLTNRLCKFHAVLKTGRRVMQLEKEDVTLSSFKQNGRWKCREIASVKNLPTALYPNVFNDIKEKVFSLMIFLSLLTEH